MSLMYIQAYNYYHVVIPVFSFSISLIYIL